ncbi:MAG: S8 family serine peptidase [Actinomycetota bacterium]|nr:S8 family serine peptidase [Actinomycetota bacterium]
MRLFIPALLAAAALLALPGSAGAVTCTHPGSAYSPGTGVEAFDGPATGDPLATAQWGLNQIKAPAAWKRGAKGAGVTVAVLDTGADFSHPDLQGKLLAGTDYVKSGDGCSGPQDENGHGTHVSGIVAANTGNGIGTAGVAPEAKILPVRVLNAEGSEPEVGVVFQGIKWAADNGAQVINLSLADLPLLATLDGSDADAEAAVNYAWQKGAVVVAAASNESFPLCNYPAAAARAICVGATDPAGFPSAYSNFPNSPEGGVGVRAPGGEGSPIFCEYSPDIWSTVWPEEGVDKGCGDVKGYETFAGTSMAAPHVAGVAALLAGRGLSNAQIVECIKQNSTGRGTYDPVDGYGIVDADTATAKCAPATTPSYQPPPPGGGNPPPPPPPGGGGSEEAQVSVTVKRTTRSRLAKSGRLRATVKSDRAVTVKLRAVLTRGKKKGTAGTKTVKLGGAGSKKATVTLSRSARRALARDRKARIVLRWRAGSKTGSATATR